jgi:hypothetical protein
MNRSIVLFGFLATAFFPTISRASAAKIATDDLETSKYVKVYVPNGHNHGDDGLRVAVLMLKGSNQGKGLVVVYGIDTKIDDIPLMAKIDKESGSLIVKLDGSDYWLVRASKTWGELDQVMLPENGIVRPIIQNLAESQRVTPEEFLRKYRVAKEGGQADQLAKFDRKAKVKAVEEEIARKLETAQSHGCPKLQMNVDWKSVNDEFLQNYSLADYCGEVIDALGSLCETSESLKSAIQKKINGVSCRIGDRMTLQLKGSTLEWTTFKDASNLWDFAKDRIREILHGKEQSSTQDTSKTKSSTESQNPQGKNKVAPYVPPAE